MRPSLLTAALAVLALPVLAACANPSHATDADDLRKELARLPGVSKVTLDYTEPVTLDSGKIDLRVEMDDGADPDAVTQVVTTAYAAFTDAHHDEEGDLDVRLGDDVVHLRTFEPDAEPADVEEATTDALAVLPTDAVSADINTQDAPGGRPVFTTYAVEIAQSDAAVVLATLADLEKSYGSIENAGWSVEGGGAFGWKVSASEGFPGAEQLALFAELRKDLPAGATIQLYDEDFPVLQLPNGTTPEVTSAIVNRHLDLIGGPKKAFYHVESGEDLHLIVADGDCTFDTGPVGVRLEQDLEDRCASVSHPE